MFYNLNGMISVIKRHSISRDPVKYIQIIAKIYYSFVFGCLYANLRWAHSEVIEFKSDELSDFKSIGIRFKILYHALCSNKSSGNLHKIFIYL